MSANLKNSAVVIGLEKFSFHSNPKEGQCQRMYKLRYSWGVPGSSAGRESACNAGDPGLGRYAGFNSWVGKICWRRDRLPTPAFLGFSCGSAGQESTHNAGELGSIPGLGRSNGEGKGYPLQYFGLENSMNCIVHGVPCCIAHGTDLEIVTKSKVSQKEKNKYHILMHIC